MGLTQEAETETTTVSTQQAAILAQFRKVEALLTVLGGRSCELQFSENILTVIREIFAGVHRVDNSQTNIRTAAMLINLANVGYAKALEPLNESEEQELKAALVDLERSLTATLEQT